MTTSVFSLITVTYDAEKVIECTLKVDKGLYDCYAEEVVVKQYISLYQHFK